MNCKNCGHEVPEPKPRVEVKEVMVDRSDGWYILRGGIVAFVFLAFLTAALIGKDVYEQYVLSRAIADPSVKIEITEYDGGGRAVKKLTR